MGEYAFGAGEMVNRLLSICFEEISLVGGVKDEVKKLETVLRVIQAVLHDAERKQGEREVVRQWLHQLKQVAYDAEDVLDEVAYKKLKYSVDTMTPRWLNPKRGIARLKIAHKIKAINTRLADIYENMKLLQLVQLEPPNNDQSGNSSGFGDNRETASDVNESAVIGRDKDKEKIIKMLINDDAAAAAAALSVIAIVGLGGIGKTTLAQLVYNDGAVKKHFELKAWVCVSTKFKVENLFSQILQLINENSAKTESSSKEVLQKELRSQLGGKKFLLVLDDDWNEDETKWEDFLLPFVTNAATGSKIIVTTRDRKVASVKGAHHALYLEGLSGEDCWGLIENQAFKRGGPLKTSRLVEIGREISKKCHGVPLAAKVLGGLLCSIKEGEWWGVLKDEIMSLDQRDLIKNVLKLSYDNLSPALQACFSYCAILPKDYLISTELLIQLWMAQGLLEAPRQQLLLKACNSQRKLTLEDAGTICFDALYSKSFFQEAKMNKYGEVTHCKIHHHLHDLAQSIMDSECQVMGESSIMRRTDLSECRHVSMISVSTIEALDEVKKLRTIFGWESTCKEPRADALFKFKSLRVLDLSGFRGYDFSYTTNSFKYLKHLRYLDLSYTSITSLPTWVTGLYHLQTLKLIECRNLTELPEDLMKLKQQLRHLFIDDYKRWKKMPQAIGELHQLQTLPFFVGHEGVGISVFKNLNELRGALDIHRLRLMKEESLAKRVIKPLRGKSNLRELRLHWRDDRESSSSSSSSSSSADGDGSNDFNVLEELQPQTNLQWLSVEDYCGVEFPGWMSSGSDLPNLKKLELRSLPNLKERGCSNVALFGGVIDRELPQFEENAASVSFAQIIVLKKRGWDGCGVTHNFSQQLSHFSRNSGLQRP